MTKRLFCICLVVLLLCAPITWADGPLSPPVTEAILQNGPLTEPAEYYLYSEQWDLYYLLTLPEGYDPAAAEKSPMILFLHGSGGGTSVEKLKGGCIPYVYDKLEEFPFVTVSPISPGNVPWNVLSDAIHHLTNEIISTYHIDPDRVYLTGYSMGGAGTWDMAMAYPEQFAAAVPVAGYGDPAGVQTIRHLPVWAFHGDCDTSVPIEADQPVVDALKACGGDVTFTVYEGAGHDIERRTYTNPELYRWFLDHPRNGLSQPAPKFTYEPEVIEMPEMQVVCARGIGDRCFADAMECLSKFAWANNIPPAPDTNVFFSVHRGNMEGSLPCIELWLPVDGEVTLTDEVLLKTIPATTYAKASRGSTGRQSSGSMELNIRRWAATNDQWRVGLDPVLECYTLGALMTNEDFSFDLLLPLLPRSNKTDRILDFSTDQYQEYGHWYEFDWNNTFRTSAAWGRLEDYAEFKPTITQPGWYKISLFKPVAAGNDPKARIDVTYTGGQDTLYLDYTQGTLDWVELGIYPLQPGGQASIRIGAGSPDAPVCASHLKIELVSDQLSSQLCDIGGHWAQRDIQELVLKGVIAGFEDGTYRPEQDVSIEEFIKLAVSTLGYSYSTDGANWAAPYLEKAQSLGLIDLADVPDSTQPITRLQMVQVLAKAIGGETTEQAPLTDLSTLSPDQQQAIYTAYSAGLVDGHDDGSFRPNDPLTRAESAAVILRLSNPGKRPQRTLPSLERTPIQADQNGSLLLLADDADINGNTSMRIKDNGNIGYWRANEQAIWQADVPKAGAYSVELTYSLLQEFAGSTIYVEAEGQELSYELTEGTPDWDTFRTVSLGTLNLPKGVVTIRAKSKEVPAETFIDLKGLRLTPVQ